MKGIMPRIFLFPVFALLILAPAHAALTSDCVQSSYPVRVIPACTEIIGKDPNNGVAYFKRGKAYLDYRTDARDLDRAIADLTKAIEIDPKYADAYNQRGIAFRRNEDFARAIADQSKAIEINPSFARAYSSRGDTYQQQKNYDRAFADYNKAIELDPAYVVTYFNRAFTHVLKDDTNRAIADLKQAFKLGGRDFDYVFDTLKANRAQPGRRPLHQGDRAQRERRGRLLRPRLGLRGS
jgi:tetratricopeptide (TPR) repeat protein